MYTAQYSNYLKCDHTLQMRRQVSVMVLCDLGALCMCMFVCVSSGRDEPGIRSAHLLFN